MTRLTWKNVWELLWSNSVHAAVACLRCLMLSSVVSCISLLHAHFFFNFFLRPSFDRLPGLWCEILIVEIDKDDDLLTLTPSQQLVARWLWLMKEYKNEFRVSLLAFHVSINKTRKHSIGERLIVFNWSHSRLAHIMHRCLFCILYCKL